MDGQVPDGQYILRDISSRPELNGRIVSVSGCSYGGGKPRTEYNAQLRATGDIVKVYADKLQPLSEAPKEVLYDGDDLNSDDHPLDPESSLLFLLRSGYRNEGFGVRVQGLTSDAGQQLNGQQGVAIRDNSNGRLGVRCQDGELRSVRIANLVLSPEAVALPSACEARAGGPSCSAASASRTAGNFADGAAQRGFFVHRPPSLQRCDTYEGAGWPGVYTRRGLKGLAAASPEHIESCESWSEAWARWEVDEDKGRDAFVFPLRAAVAADVTADELFDCFRWFLLGTRLGREISKTDGVGLLGAHVEAMQGAMGDGMPTALGFVVLSVCGNMFDLMSKLVDKVKWRLTLRGQPLAFTCTARSAVSTDTPLGTPKQKRRVDDWLELKACPNAPFAFAQWQYRNHPSATEKSWDMFMSDGDAALVVG